MPKKLIFSLMLIFGISVVLIGCGEAEEALDELEGDPTPTTSATANPTPLPGTNPTPRPTRTPRPSPSPTSEPSGSGNPIATGPQNFIDGANGNLWKPVSENNGNLVVLFDPKWKKLFSQGCYVNLKNGSRERLFCGGVLECFTNPNRMTLRSNVRCSQVSEVRVTCEEAKQTVTFTVPQNLRSQVCSRHD